MRRQEFIRGAEKYLGNALRAGMRQQQRACASSTSSSFPATPNSRPRNAAATNILRKAVCPEPMSFNPTVPMTSPLDRATQKPPAPDW